MLTTIRNKTNGILFPANINPKILIVRINKIKECKINFFSILKNNIIDSGKKIKNL